VGQALSPANSTAIFSRSSAAQTTQPVKITSQALVRVRACGSGVEQIGRYRILDELGRGATGVVYRAQDPAINRVIAIKTIRLSDFTDEAERDRLRERLFREAQSAGILSHPNIVTIYDISEENGLAYIFMEFVDGPPLEKILNSTEPLLPDGVLSILRQIALALDYAHKKGIVHRDIKPANILIHESTLAKITDFGVAKILSQQMTQSGVMMGTPNYMSPEQVQGHAVDGRADQFSLAVIAYEILTGEKPFVADHLPSLLYRIVREDPVPPQRLNPTLSPQVEVVLRKALSKSASDRYPTAVEFVEALADAVNANPSWHPLPRSGAQNLPTIGGGAALHHTSAPASTISMSESAPEPVRATHVLPTRPVREDDAESGNPLLKSLLWMLVGIGLVGLVLFGAQKFLFNRNSEPVATTESPTAPSPPDTPSDQPVSKPSPIGESRAADKTTQEPAKTPQTTQPESTKPEVPKPPTTQAQNTQPETAKPAETAPSETPPRPHADSPPRREVSTIPPPVVVKPGADRTVQFLTDPPGAKVIIDDNSSLTCKSPCMLQLPSGRHAMNVQLPGFRAYPRVFNVPQDGDIFLQLSKASGTLSVTSTPPGATIEINNEMQSKHTPALFNLPPGTYHVRVARSGAFLDFDAEIRDQAVVVKNVSF
jgi:serine/threonine protein kinase